MKNGGLILWCAFAICEMFKTSWQMEKHLMDGVSENHFEGSAIPFGAMVEYHPIPARDQSRLHHFGKTSFTCNIPRIRIDRVENLERRHFWLQTLTSWENLDASEVHSRRLNAQEVLTPRRSDNSTFPIADGTAKLFGSDRGV